MLNNNDKKTLSESVQLYALLANLICFVKRNKGCPDTRLLEDGCVRFSSLFGIYSRNSI